MLNERNTLLEDDGIEEEILVEEECSVAQAVWGDIQGNIENQTDLQNALDAKQDSLTEAQLSAVNSGITSEKVTTYDGYADQIANKADQSALNAETIARGEADTALGTRIDNEALARQSADNGLQTQIDAITSKSDVVDVVANYAALQAYDTSTLGNNDVVKVLDDETHEDALTYYRWSTTTQTWSYIGQEAPYYSKGQMDVMLQGKQDTLTAGANIQIENGVISATDTKYTNGNGLNLNGTQFSADTDVLATKEDLESYYTKPETDNLLAPKLEAEVVAELPATGAEGKLYLTPKAHTTSTATGNPIEATVTEQAGQLESFQLFGDTFQQSYTGKNLLVYPYYNTTETVSGITFTDNGDGSVTVNGTTTGPESLFWITRDIWKYSTENIVVPAGTYTISPTGNSNVRLYLTAYGETQGLLASVDASTASTTFTIAEKASLTIRISVKPQGTWVTNLVIKPQLESGSTSTSFEPFVGGQPSPNPDYPQQIQTVTGTQTISINGTDYPLNLGDIQLCGLGDDGNGNPLYKDYIYPDGESWKVHKATGKATFSSLNWQDYQIGSTGHYRIYSSGIAQTVLPPSANNVNFIGYCSIYTNKTSSRTYAREEGCSVQGDGYANTGTIFIYDADYDYSGAATNWKTARGAGQIYFVLKTATDTVITDATLIAQLEAIRTASLATGANTITNNATGSNLAGDMEIGYFEFNPTNRYDKFIWLNLNNNYEQIGGE